MYDCICIGVYPWMILVNELDLLNDEWVVFFGTICALYWIIEMLVQIENMVSKFSIW